MSSEHPVVSVEADPAKPTITDRLRTAAAWIEDHKADVSRVSLGVARDEIQLASLAEMRRLFPGREVAFERGSYCDIYALTDGSQRISVYECRREAERRSLTLDPLPATEGGAS